MKRLHLYVIKTFLGPFFLTFFICMFVLLMQFLWKYIDELVGKGLELNLIAELIFYASFGLLPLAFPLSMLIASLMTFGSLGENYELVAIKSSGISLARIMRPLMVLAVILACTAFYFANYVLPQTNLRFAALLWSIKEQKPELVIKEGVFTNEIEGYSIKVDKRDKKTNLLYDIIIYNHTRQSSNQSNVTVADSGFIRMTEDKKYMILTLYDGFNYIEEEVNNRSLERTYPHRKDAFKEQVLNIELKDFQFNRRDENIFRNNYRMLRINQLREAEDSMQVDYRKRVRSFITQLNFNIALKRNLLNHTAPYDTLKREWFTVPDTIVDFEQLFAGIDDWRKNEILTSTLTNIRSNHQMINNSVRMIYERKKWINRHEMERHKKFTLSIAVLIFFFIGAPLGAIIRKGGLGMPVVVSILLFIIYYILSMMGEKSAREDLWDMVIGMWFSSFVFVSVGVWLTYKAINDAGIMRAETYTDLLKKLRLSRFIKLNTATDENSADYQ